MAAEREARLRAAPCEIDLKAIYLEFAKKHSMAPDEIMLMMQGEIALELASLRAVPEIKERIQNIHDAGEAVVYISEMYLPPEVIQQALQAEGIWGAQDRLYVSCESGLHKTRGLFELMLKEENLSPNEVTHTGDNIQADVRYPAKIGINVTPFTATVLNRYEILLSSASNPENAEAASLYAGAARLARLRVYEKANKNQDAVVFREAGTSIIGPLFIPYVRWVMQEAARRNIKQLYFIARDGQIFKKLAENLPEGREIECRYLYGSRQAWHLPGIISLEEEHLDWILCPDPSLTFRGLLKRIGVSVEEICNCIEDKVVLPEADQPLSLKDYRHLRTVFLRDSVRQFVENKAAKARKTALGYFREQGLLDLNNSWGIVDIGWGGNIQRSLQRILSMSENSSSPQITGFYFFLRTKPVDKSFCGLSFLPATARPALVKKLDRWLFLLEIFARADHGGVHGYHWTGGHYAPILNQNESVDNTLRGVREQQEGALAFQEAFMDLGRDFHINLETCLHAFLAFARTPTDAEANVYGKLPFQSDQTGETRFLWAPRLSALESFSYCFRANKNEWQQAMPARNKGVAKVVLCSFLALKRYLGRY